jgi:hypothetical protein
MAKIFAAPQAFATAMANHHRHGLARNRTRKHRVHRIAERIEQRAEVARYRRIELPDIARRNLHKVRKRAVRIHTQDLHELADMGLPAAALQAMSAGHMHLRRDKITDANTLHTLAHRRNRPAKLMPGNIWRFDPRLRPLVPMKDVQVRSADARRLHGHQHIGRADLRNGHGAHLHPRAGRNLHQCLHRLRNHPCLASLLCPLRLSYKATLELCS